MEKQENFIKRYKFDELINNTMSMLKYTWKSSLVVSVCVFVPIAFIYSFGMSAMFAGMFGNLSDLITGYDGTSADTVFRVISILAPFYLFLFGMALVMGLGVLFVHAIVQLTAFNKIRGDVKPLKQVLVEVISRILVPLILQSLLVGAIITGAMVLFGIGIFLIVGVTALSGINALMILLVVLATIGFVCFIVWFSNAVTFASESIVFDRLTATGSIPKSFSLVRNNWWRVFGILLLVGIMLSFASGLVTGPIIGVMILPSYFKMLKTLMESVGGSEGVSGAYFSSIVEFFKTAQIPMFVSMALSLVIESMILPVVRGLFYIDLKVRKNELEEPETEQPVENTAGDGAGSDCTEEEAGTKSADNGDAPNDGQ